MNGISKASSEYEKFKFSDDKEFEVSYFGPTGNGINGEPIGCKRFFEEIDFNTSKAESLSSCMDNFSRTFAGNRSDNRGDLERNNVILDGMTLLVKSFCEAMQLPE